MIVATTRSAWAAQARDDFELFGTVTAILTATDRHLQEVCEDLSPADLTDVVDQSTAAIERFGCLLWLLTTARARVTLLAAMAADGRLAAVKQARLAQQAEESQRFIESLRGRTRKAA